jgi:hypothetical protein
VTDGKIFGIKSGPKKWHKAELTDRLKYQWPSMSMAYQDGRHLMDSTVMEGKNFGIKSGPKKRHKTVLTDRLK